MTNRLQVASEASTKTKIDSRFVFYAGLLTLVKGKGLFLLGEGAFEVFQARSGGRRFSGPLLEMF